jgi:uncharacterized protein YegP (UPF0339 family)
MTETATRAPRASRKGKKRKGKVEFYRDEKDEHRWRIFSPNGNNRANCGEGYKNQGDMLDCFDQVVSDEVKSWPRYFLGRAEA